MKHIVIAILLVLCSLPACAAEPVQPLLAELTSPVVLALPALEQVALVPRDEVTDEEEPQHDVSELFTLE